MGSPASLEALIHALESQLDTIQNYYDRETGEVVMVSEEFGEGPGDMETEADRYLHISPFTTNERFQIMEDFVESLPDDGLIEELNQALIGKGAFQRFEEALQKYPTRRKQWHSFRAAKVGTRANGSGSTGSIRTPSRSPRS